MSFSSPRGYGIHGIAGTVTPIRYDAVLLSVYIYPSDTTLKPVTCFDVVSGVPSNIRTIAAEIPSQVEPRLSRTEH